MLLALPPELIGKVIEHVLQIRDPKRLCDHTSLRPLSSVSRWLRDITIPFLFRQVAIKGGVSETDRVAFLALDERIRRSVRQVNVVCQLDPPDEDEPANMDDQSQIVASILRSVPLLESVRFDPRGWLAAHAMFSDPIDLPVWTDSLKELKIGNLDGGLIVVEEQDEIALEEQPRGSPARSLLKWLHHCKAIETFGLEQAPYPDLPPRAAICEEIRRALGSLTELRKIDLLRTEYLPRAGDAPHQQARLEAIVARAALTDYTAGPSILLSHLPTLKSIDFYSWHSLQPLQGHNRVMHSIQRVSTLLSHLHRAMRWDFPHLTELHIQEHRAQSEIRHLTGALLAGTWPALRRLSLWSASMLCVEDLHALFQVTVARSITIRLGLQQDACFPYSRTMPASFIWAELGQRRLWEVDVRWHAGVEAFLADQTRVFLPKYAQ
ncbi:uncharacterized protein L969DRAFT_96138 [Mixia osmundae IAM 14324]|uniref:Uncharacterized protein n=1 Tax=Mixia osmundae (strain CBS 9802 / IAM 14324 / JCM 22182 / KY 12970) TaxID=764103 RepID=G7EA54_MIXOS|nr:uncharacterized protein L969DRAFT_96138 [Mixia osmundae IAM 14324]KEI37612.1 hypothetical protein L969DRAFT_96138 [Mixia osmundae IAM 14324]GAA99714.1 hypothetical protein E5Q_06417 [Mixia osmundae IAM 14324]